MKLVSIVFIAGGVALVTCGAIMLSGPDDPFYGGGLVIAGFLSMACGVVKERT